jgi:hypothetical protein
MNVSILRQRDRVREAINFEVEKLRNSRESKGVCISGLEAYVQLSYCHGQLTENLVEQWEPGGLVNDEDELTLRMIHNVAVAITILEMRKIIL